MRPGARSRGAFLLPALLLAACEGATLPAPRIPQLEQAQATVQGDRYRTHAKCMGLAKTVDALITCMRDEGWDFVGREPTYPEAGCWQARDQGELDKLPSQCFLQSASAGGVPR